MDTLELVEKLERELLALEKQRAQIKAETDAILRQIPNHTRTVHVQAAASPRPTDQRALLGWLGNHVLAAQADVRRLQADLSRFTIARCVENPAAARAALKPKPAPTTAPTPAPKRFDARAFYFDSGSRVRVLPRSNTK